ncbi:hypothetical protein SAMN05216223_11276 [Actinacidiphila yanglinensis]|uniref:Uncharacterized protein n=1 Tax=Actinacidiphila yanglinensis TaxID=310779 RepID=A0A1H6D5S4_9ACTN|nr:hypothetical protein [Actinacidiphila yanglinensis]SEG80670.1 hypothetical protein SAMN05216223_11276 [Actinacidiphila yanglinensis]
MHLIRRAADHTTTTAEPPAPSPTQAAVLPQQAVPTTRADAINVSDIARKPRAVANALQKLYGI